MARNIISHKPISNDDRRKMEGKYPLVDLILNTGCRIMEIKRLIDKWEKPVPFIDIETKKSNGQLNRIFLNKTANKSLEMLQKLSGISKRTLQRRYTTISQECGVEFTPHNLRSTFATKLADMGVDLVTIQHLMNHKNIDQTAQYIQFSEIRYQSAVSLLEEYKSLEGMTPFELLAEIHKKNKKILRLESEIKTMQEKNDDSDLYEQKKEFVFGKKEYNNNISPEDEKWIKEYKEARQW